jgi:signal transduction histidine kinase
MEPVTPAIAATMRGHILSAGRRGILREPFDHPLKDRTLTIRSAVVAPLMIRDAMVGAVLVANRLDDVSDFENDDARLLETIASQVAVSLENGRLEDSLAQLTALKEQLENLVRSKDEFVASVSHELRTPLTAVVGLAEELRCNRGAFSEDEVREFMDLIAEQSGELHNIVEDLLVAARADFGTLQLNIETFDLAAETQMVVARHTPAGAPAESITVVGSCSPVRADRLRVRQILRNLLTNADRYGGRRVWVELTNRGDRVSVAVLDDGNGVPDRQTEAIFEPYRRADTAERQPLAVGLGLAVSRKLAEKMEGGLEYHRRAGCTVFELLLPPAADQDVSSRSQLGSVTGPRSSFRL